MKNKLKTTIFAELAEEGRKRQNQSVITNSPG
jgi:hypothetical protein